MFVKLYKCQFIGAANQGISSKISEKVRKIKDEILVDIQRYTWVLAAICTMNMDIPKR